MVTRPFQMCTRPLRHIHISSPRQAACSSRFAAVGFFGQHRHHIRELVNSSGATYSGDLLEGFTTHLVYKDLNAAKCGEKYATALEWGIPVLPFSWLTESAAHQQLLPADAVPRVLTAEGLTCPATKLQMLSLQVCLSDNTAPALHCSTSFCALSGMFAGICAIVT